MVGRRPVLVQQGHGGDGGDEELAAVGLLRAEEGQGVALGGAEADGDDDGGGSVDGTRSLRPPGAHMSMSTGARMMAALGSRSVEVDDVEPAPDDHSEDAEAQRRQIRKLKRKRSLVTRAASAVVAVPKFWLTAFDLKQAKVQTKGQFDDRYSDNINYFDPAAFFEETGIDILEGADADDLPSGHSRCRYCWSWAWTALVLLTIKLVLCAPLICLPCGIGRVARSGVRGSLKTMRLITVGFPGYGEAGRVPSRISTVGSPPTQPTYPHASATIGSLPNQPNPIHSHSTPIRLPTNPLPLHSPPI